MSSRGNHQALGGDAQCGLLDTQILKRLRKSPEWLGVKRKLGEALSVFALSCSSPNSTCSHLWEAEHEAERTLILSSHPSALNEVLQP